MKAVSMGVETERHRRLPGVCWDGEGLTAVISGLASAKSL